jgi:hypothetical protein
MSTSSLQVLGISTEESDWEYQLKHKSTPAFRVHGRVTVYDQDGSFESVRITLRGAIKTRIGSRNALEQLPSSRLLKSHLDFKPTYSASQHAAEEQHLDFVMTLPSRSTQQNNSKNVNVGQMDTFVPSLSIAGSSYVTRVTALKDRHLVEGHCEVVYWLEAELLRSNVLVRMMSCPVDVSSLHVPLDVEVTNQATQIEQTIKPKSRGLSKVFSSQPLPQLSIQMPRQLGTISSGPAKIATGTRNLSIPVTVSLDLPSGTSPQTLASIENSTLQCTARAHWYTRRTFATSNLSHFASKPLNPEIVVRNTTVSAQKLQLNLPPLYTSTVPSSKYTTSMILDLALPESVSSPSVSTSLLDINYTLDLSMKFSFSNADNNNTTTHSTSIMRPCTAEFHLPVTLSAAQPAAMLNLHHHLDPLEGLVERGLVLAPPPYIS